MRFLSPQRLMSALTVTFTLGLGLPAAANTPSFEFWGSTEFQLMLSPETDPNLAWHDIIPDRFRVYSELQFAHDIGLQQSMLRIGPIWNLLPWLTVAAHVSSAGMPTSEGRFNQEVRLEFEPSLKGSITPDLRWANRHRLEYRMRPDRQFWRYRTRANMSYHFPDSPWTPFIANEFHFVTDPAYNGNFGFSQNRAMLGISYQINPSTQVSLSYLNRLVHTGTGWIDENGLFFSLFYASNEDGIFQMNAD